jgi:hypothetical protein
MKDSRRSGEFYVGCDREADDDVGLSLLEIWNGYSGDDIGTGAYDMPVFVKNLGCYTNF